MNNCASVSRLISCMIKNKLTICLTLVSRYLCVLESFPLEAKFAQFDWFVRPNLIAIFKFVA